MPREALLDKESNQVAARSPHPLIRRWVIGGLVALAAFLIAYGIFLAVDWPFKEQALIDVLQERFARPVVIDRFQRTYLPPGCVAEGIKFLHRKHKDKPPLITVQKLEIQGSYTGLLRIRKRLPFVRVVGLHVTIPPPQPGGGPNPVMPLTHSSSHPLSSIIVGTTIANGAVLDFLPATPRQKTFRLVIDNLRLDNIGNDKAVPYWVRFDNTTPPGIIESTGSFGPWQVNDPGSTPVKGSYRYSEANLAVFRGIAGTLFSIGNFAGTLGRIEVTGTAKVPNFHVTGTSHTRPLVTEFRAAVDARNGNTQLEQVFARFDRTTLTANGMVASHAGESGKTASLDIESSDGRIEDLLKLFISAKQAPMTGNIRFRAHAELPPTPQAFVQKIRLTGEFGVGSGKFTNRETESNISRLSESAQSGRRRERENEETVLSNLTGHAGISGGVAELSNVSFNVPGAAAQMNGSYSLVDYKVNLHGTLETTGKPSDATPGFKSFLLKALTPFFKKQGKAKLVPFKITGTYGRADIGLDLGSKKEIERLAGTDQ